MPTPRWLVPLVPVLVFAWGAAPAAEDGFALRPGDSLCLLGNALAERMQHHGWLEARLQTRFPDLQLSVRNLGFNADELTVQQRTAGFGSWDDYLDRCDASVVFAFFGYVESFRGLEHLPQFREDLAAFIDHVTTRVYDGEQPPRLVLFSPIAFEDQGRALPDPARENLRIAAFARAVEEVAAAKAVTFVDLFTPSMGLYSDVGPLTVDGAHLTSAGNAWLAESIERSLFGQDLSSGTELLDKVREAVLAKNLIWFNRYRATDGYNVYGGRSSLEYDSLTNFEVLQREMEVLDATAARMDRTIWALASEDAATIAAAESRASAEVEVPPLIDVPTNRPGELPGGKHRFMSGDAAIAQMTTAPGTQVSLFASEADFPELANPVQMSWDTRGRLWVATWPTYPHWEPGQPMNDKLVILEDTDGDGRADTCTTFVDDLHNPTGFEFWNGGVFVANAPDLLFLQDLDGDDRITAADTRERVLGGLSSADTHHSANSFVMGPDGALYFQEGTFHQTQIESIFGPVRNHNGCVWRYEPRTHRVERYIPYGFANPHGHVFDRWGQDFMTDGTGNVNYYALPFSGHVVHPDKHRAYFPFFQQRSRPAAATEILSSSHFPEENQGNYLIANVIGFQGIFQYEIHDDGSGFSATETDPILFSADGNFRPVDLEIGPDGALYLLDWQNPLIGHMQHHLRDPSRDHDHGRVYRVTATGRELLEPVPIAGRAIPELLELLDHPDDRVRYRTRIELSARDTSEVTNAIMPWLAASGVDVDGADDERRELEALWLLQQHDVWDGYAFSAALLDSDDHRIRAAVIRVVRQMRHHVDSAGILDGLERAMNDPHPRVRLEGLVGCSFVPDARAAELALRTLDFESDRFLDYALEETMRTLEPQWRAALTSGEPFAAEHPAGLAWMLQRLDTAELSGVRPGEMLFSEILTRHGLETADYERALAGLADARGSSRADELLAAIQRADLVTEGHVDHLLSGLFDTLAALPPTERDALAVPLANLATEARRPSTRRLATAARIRADGTLEPAWNEARHSVGALADLLDAAPLLNDRALTSALHPRVVELLAGPPAELDTGLGGTTGRYVRVELPGNARTLTLAEVVVESRGDNVAVHGTASQSSTNWAGTADRAIDGIRSGSWGDGAQSHTVEDQPDPWWELDLGAPLELDSIALYNRTDGDLGARLEDYTLRVLDGNRKTVFSVTDQAAPAPVASHDLSSPVVFLRRSAARCLGALGVNDAGAADALRPYVEDEPISAAVVSALLALHAREGFRVSPAAAGDLADWLLRRFETQPAVAWQRETGREQLALADAVAPWLDDTDAARLRAVRRTLGPQVVVVRPIRDALLYDLTAFAVVAGKPIELTFENVDIMPHNLVVGAQGSLARVGLAAEAMASDPDAWDKAYVPDLPEVLVATGLLNPGQDQTLIFTAPEQPGRYPFVCTFPGHWVRMNGVMTVVAGWDERDAFDAEQARVRAATAPAGGHAEHAGGGEAASTRRFVDNWTRAEFPTDLDGLGFDDEAVLRGRAVLEEASCLLCHRVGAAGGLTGPELTEVVGRYDREGLLTQLLDPSAILAEGYAAELLFTRDGGVVAGRVRAEDEHEVSIQEDPYSETLTVVLVEDIDERRSSDVSVMPDGLLWTYHRAEVLDLLAYLDSLR